MTKVRHYLKPAFFKMMNKVYVNEKNSILPKASPSISTAVFRKPEYFSLPKMFSTE